MPDITIPAGDASFGAYLAVPQTTPAPGVVVAQEIFGVNKVMRDLCDGFAAAGYIACSPDLFWRQEPGVQLTDQIAQAGQEAVVAGAQEGSAAGIVDPHRLEDPGRVHLVGAL